MFSPASPRLLFLVVSLLISSAVSAEVRTFRIVSDDSKNVVQFVSEATLVLKRFANVSRNELAPGEAVNVLAEEQKISVAFSLTDASGAQKE